MLSSLVSEHRKLIPDEAEKILMDGNKRFISGEVCERDLSYRTRLKLSEGGQHPIAVVITCSDSRVIPELIFDQGLGDIFVVRNAGNIINASELGSIEYAVKHLNVPLVLILGHEKCGAVRAAIDGEGDGTNISMIINQIIPSIQKVKAGNEKYILEELISKTEDENIKNSTRNILRSHIIKEYVEKGEVKIVPSKYCLGTGEVKFLRSYTT